MSLRPKIARFISDAAKPFVCCGAAAVLFCPAVLLWSRGGRSVDPYDNLADIDLGARVGVGFLIGCGAELVGFVLLILAAFLDGNVRTKKWRRWLSVSSFVALLMIIVVVVVMRR
jgi:hypothetical protein